MQNIVLFCVGLAFFILGFLLTTKRGVAEWGLQQGRAKIWVKLFGMERAVKLTRYFFGPFTTLLGLFVLVMSILSTTASSHHNAFSTSKQKSCDDLKAEIAEKIEANGTRKFTLDIVNSDEANGLKVVGSCDSGKRKITYKKHS